MDLSRAGEQLVPADHALAQVHLVQPHVGLPDQGLLHELAAVGHQEQLVRGAGSRPLSAGKISTTSTLIYDHLKHRYV